MLLSVMVVAVESETSELAATEMALLPETTGVSKAVEVEKTAMAEKTATAEKTESVGLL